MANKTVFVVLALVIALLATPTFALWGEFPNDKPVVGDNWPTSILKAINAHRRVYGAGAYDTGWTFYFTGGTADVNRFLEQVAGDKVAMLGVVLKPEPGVDRITTGVEQKETKIEYSWSLHLYLYRDVIGVMIPKDGESDAEFARRRAKLPEFAAAITVHCVGAIDAGTLKVPLRFEASVGGRLATLADYHNRRRSDLETDGKPIEEEPSDAAMAERPRMLFGSPTTKPSGEKGK